MAGSIKDLSSYRFEKAQEQIKVAENLLEKISAGIRILNLCVIQFISRLQMPDGRGVQNTGSWFWNIKMQRPQTAVWKF